MIDTCPICSNKLKSSPDKSSNISTQYLMIYLECGACNSSICYENNNVTYYSFNILYNNKKYILRSEERDDMPFICGTSLNEIHIQENKYDTIFKMNKFINFLDYPSPIHILNKLLKLNIFQ